MLKIALIIGSTRPQRFADTPARWIQEGAAGRHDLQLETLDLREQNLPLFQEPASPTRTKGVFTTAAAEAWRSKLARYDGFIATVAEYNHGPTGALKNAFDSALLEWARKPIAFVGYGSVGGARAIEHLRGVAIELQMVPIKFEVNIGVEHYAGVLREGKSLNDYQSLEQARTAMFNDLLWWARTLKPAREQTAAQAA